MRRSSPSTEAVDFGAGCGTFARSLRESGREVKCVEPDASQRLRLVEQGFETFASIDSLPDESISLLFSLNVFEHIEDDREAMRSVYAKLKPQGIVVIYVPAFNCLWSSLDDKVCHYRRYTKTNLRKLSQEGKFVVERLQYADSLGFYAALLFRLFGKSPKALTARSIFIYDRWAFPASRALDFFFHPFFGKNVFMVCRKV